MWQAGAPQAGGEREVGLDARLVPLAEPLAEARSEPWGAEQAAAQGEPSAGAVGPLVSPAPLQVAFFDGYRAAGGAYPEARIDAMIQCESSWNPLAVSPWGHKGLSQFTDYSWATVAGVTGYWEWTDPWQMGYNTAVWMSMTEPSEQWACW